MSEKAKAKAKNKEPIFGFSDVLTPNAKRYIKIGAFVVVLGILIGVFGNSVARTVYERGLAQKCAEIEKDPNLAVPCRCVPMLRPSNVSEREETESNPLCVCNCTLPDNTTIGIDVRASKPV